MPTEIKPATAATVARTPEALEARFEVDKPERDGLRATTGLATLGRNRSGKRNSREDRCHHDEEDRPCDLRTSRPQERHSKSGGRRRTLMIREICIVLSVVETEGRREREEEEDSEDVGVRGFSVE